MQPAAQDLTVRIEAVKPVGKPPVLLFDLGNILVRLNSVDLLWPDRLAEPGTLPFAERWLGSQAVRAYESGLIHDLDTFYRAARAELGFSVPEEQFVQVFRQVIGDLFSETIPLLTALQGSYPLMLLSNTSQEHWVYCRDQLGLGGFFKKEFLSYQMGVMKPDPLIYQKLLAGSGTSPENIWFFDDNLNNVAAARKLGIRAWSSWGGQPLLELLQGLKIIKWLPIAEQYR